jgi:tRNA(Ile)-lysidine synthase
MTTPGDPGVDRSAAAAILLDEMLQRCTFADDGPVDIALSGGPDSTALLALAHRAGLEITAHHVDHRLRPESGADAEVAARIAGAFGVPLVAHAVSVPPGANLEARAREARRAAMPRGVLTGHTADDQAETVLLRLMRGSGSTGLGAIEPGPTHPILALRRTETEAICASLAIRPARDRSNEVLDVWRNRIRAEALPLLTDIAGRDLTPILGRTADLLREESNFLDELAAAVDATDALALAAEHPVLARRALRRWLSEGGYPPDSAAIDRVLAVARGDAVACELPGGRRVERSGQRLRVLAD